MSAVLVTITNVTVLAGGSTTFAHQLSVHRTGVKPDEIAIDRLGAGLDIDPANVTTTNVRVDNPTASDITANIRCWAWHSTLRAFTTGGGSAFTGLSPQPFVQTDGGSGGGSVHQQVFRYVCTGAEGSDFFIPLPVARANDLYVVFGSLASVTNIFGWNFQNSAAADRTTLQFRVITTIAVTAGDTFELSVQDTI